MPHISIVSPVYMAEKILPELVSRIETSVEKITTDYEIILVEDCGSDNSWEVIEQLSKNKSYLKGIKLSRNFGQHYAITCGLDHARGEWVVVMDCDLQDQPEEIEKLYKKAIEGFDVVFARRVERNDSFLKKLGSLLFYKVFTYLSGMKQDGTIANFGVYSKKVIDYVNTMREPMRAFSPMIRWVGFKSIAITVEHNKRIEGRSSYNVSKLINLALDIALAYSDKPLKLTIKLGLVISSFSFIFAFVSLMRYFLGYISISGYASLIISIWMLSGIIIFIIGIVGLYITKIFEGIKERPIYIIDKKINTKNNEKHSTSR
ncbi:glycosyltransferase family 2 protein [Psychroflexus sp. CAK57W]|uniref:glycosyltransferase family 2 protein n=1 Tax=Psychroflexus curvus TaxID=2873595 RepID=UPI001CCF1A24|nr:glycosyltransferase family 2 protein [Psychroflexus curvus]MBZ9787829.1 glycosyltransferase family 2 protein [Psychroflexus curvus]